MKTSEIEAFIGRLVEEIQLRQELVRGLQVLMGPPDAEGGWRKAEDGRRKVESRGPRVEEEQKAATGHHSRKPRGDVVEAARKLTEPFTTADLARATGLSIKAAYSTIHRWMNRMWVNRSSLGEYRRSGHFPPPLDVRPPSGTEDRGRKTEDGGRKADDGTAETEPAPRRGVQSAVEIETQIKEACRQRDDARSRGRDRIAQIFQDKIDGLQKRLADI